MYQYMNLEEIVCEQFCFHFRLLEELGHRSDCNSVQAMKFLQGLVLAINCTAETPMFLFSGTYSYAPSKPLFCLFMK